MKTFSIFALAAAAGFVAGSPAGLDTRTIVDYGVQNDNGNSAVGTKRTVVDFGVHNDNGAADSKVKRSPVVVDFQIRDLADRPVEKRSSDYISSCGSTWMKIYDQAGGSGYNSAVEAFCYHVTHALDNSPTVIGPGQYASALVMDGYILTSGLPAQVAFEIHNKQSDGSHIPNYDNCVTYLEKMSASGSKCYGKKNIDTKGGTWQVGNDKISYHGLPASQV